MLIPCSWEKKLWFYSNHEIHESIPPSKMSRSTVLHMYITNDQYIAMHGIPLYSLYTHTILYTILTKSKRSRDAAAKKYRYKRSRDK